MMLHRYLKRNVKRLILCSTVVAITAGALLRYVRSTSRQPDGPMVYRYAVDNAALTVRHGQHSLYADRVGSLSDASVQVLYQQRGGAHLEVTADCSSPTTPIQTDEGWSVCSAGPFALRAPACLTFSFSQRMTSWQFEAALADPFKCQVFVFDPHIPAKHQVEDESPYRLREGLRSSASEAAVSWFTESYSGHLKRLKCDDLLIDVLKLDIGESAWPVLETAAKDGLLENVKQLLLAVPVVMNASMAQMRNQISIFADLHQRGFRLWRKSYVRSMFSSDKIRDNSLRLHFVNSKFADGERASSFTGQLPDPLASLAVTKLPEFNELNRLRHQNLPQQLPQAAAELSAAFRQLTRQRHFHCPNSRQVGDLEVCVSGPFDIRWRRPCVVVSFGLVRSDVPARVMVFEERLAGGYKCQVHVIDNQKLLSDGRSRLNTWVKFHLAGLSADGDSLDESSGLSLLTLCSVFRDIGFTAPKEVDILKVDWDSADEWRILDRAIKDGCLRRVRQLIIRTHPETSSGKMSAYYATALRTLAKIYNIGFANWNPPEPGRRSVASSSSSNEGHDSRRGDDLYLINTHLANL